MTPSILQFASTANVGGSHMLDIYIYMYISQRLAHQWPSHVGKYTTHGASAGEIHGFWAKKSLLLSKI